MQRLINAERFWLMCQTGPVNTCWLWKGPVGWAGFGLFHLKDGTSERAHRIAFMLSCQKTLELGEPILQRCGKKLCCNPHHLTRGKRRGARRGALHGRAKLQESDVRAIRRLSSAGRSGRSLSRDFAVSPSTICRILNRKIWTHIE